MLRINDKCNFVDSYDDSREWEDMSSIVEIVATEVGSDLYTVQISTGDLISNVHVDRLTKI